MSAWRGYGYCLLVVVISLMAGCAAHGPAFKKITEIPTGKGVVYIYRSPGIVGSAVSYQVYVGNSSLGRLVPGGTSPTWQILGNLSCGARQNPRVP